MVKVNYGKNRAPIAKIGIADETYVVDFYLHILTSSSIKLGQLAHECAVHCYVFYTRTAFFNSG